MDPNTHSAFVVGNSFSMFIDGIPDECDHDWNGATVHTTQSGKKIYWHTFRRWSSFTSQFRDVLIIQHQEKECDPIIMQAGLLKVRKRISPTTILNPMKPQTMLCITAYASVTISIFMCYLLSSYTYAEMVTRHQYPPALWGTALVGSFIVIAIGSFLVVGHLVAVTNKMFQHWNK